MTKENDYQYLYSAFEATLQQDLPKEVHLTNLCAMLRKQFNLFWAGFYTRVSENELRLWLYQGDLPCFRIALGKGLCGRAAHSGQSQISMDVTKESNYIACHSESRSELVVPGMVDGVCQFVMDLDHESISFFDDTDIFWMEKIVGLVVKHQLIAQEWNI